MRSSKNVINRLTALHHRANAFLDKNDFRNCALGTAAFAALTCDSPSRKQPCTGGIVFDHNSRGRVRGNTFHLDER